MKTWTIVIADNHPVSRAGLRLVLEGIADFEVIGEATSGQQAIRVCQQLVPDIVLMDVNMPNGNGVDATTILHRQFPTMIIIAVSGFRHEEMQQEIMRAGAAGYISKETEFTDMIQQIFQIAGGKKPSTEPTVDRFNLTHMEHRVLLLLAEGYDRQQIAGQLTLSINTVKMHLRNIYQKLGISNAKDAIHIAMTHGLLS